jgi:alpha-tubulin suppressor-like RCC1 family protein
LSSTTGAVVTASPTTTTTYTVTGTTNGCSATNSSTVIAYPVFSPGSTHVLAIKPNGTLWGWGANGSGGLGNGNNTSTSSSTQIGADTDWQSVSAGNEAGYGIKTNGKLYSWGNNSYGQLGNGNTSNTNTPAQVGSSSDWAKVFGGNFRAFGIKTDGTLWAIGGYNLQGQLGLGDNTDRNSPVQIGTDNNWVKLGLGDGFTVGLKTDGTIWAWGTGALGQRMLQIEMFPRRLEQKPIGQTFLRKIILCIVSRLNQMVLFGHGAVISKGSWAQERLQALHPQFKYCQAQHG